MQKHKNQHGNNLTEQVIVSFMVVVSILRKEIIVILNICDFMQEEFIASKNLTGNQIVTYNHLNCIQ